MKLVLTESIQQQVIVALDKLPIKYKDEAQEISKLDSLDNASVSVDLLEQVTNCLGKCFTFLLKTHTHPHEAIAVTIITKN
jgi:hypothetical protein